jgi:hypothetical protein
MTQSHETDKQHAQINNIVLPPPTPQDIEATLTAMRNDMSASCLWLGGYLEEGDLWWVTIILPNGERDTAIGCGRSCAEAAAVAWINYVFDSDEEDFAKVVRHVPEGFQFELHAAPVPALKFLEVSPFPSLKSALLAERKKSASDGEFLEHLHGLLQEIIPNFSATLTYEE